MLQVADYSTHKAEVSTVEADNSTTSVLRVSVATDVHSGVYTCDPSNAREASVKVHVLSGEQPAAMQTNRGSCNRTLPLHLLTVTVTLLVLQSLWSCVQSVSTVIKCLTALMLQLLYTVRDPVCKRGGAVDTL
ncbi:hypothetical protein FHG87_017731 [Trinorchestia longiramus]|nr:hypothetical protein FHG87_017731 [Trinorchestia longiramus]